MKKMTLQFLSILLTIGFTATLTAEDNICVKYSKKMSECMKKEFAKPCAKKPKCSMCESFRPNPEMEKANAESYASMPCEGEFKDKSEKNFKLSCARDKYIQESLKSMKQSMKTMPDCK